jgi:hypothetical protein
MTCSVLVVGLPTPGACDPGKTWRAAASGIELCLTERFGSAVQFEYAELFTSDMERHADVETAIASGEAVPPIVVIDGVRRFSGGKLNISAIERAVAQALPAATPTARPEPTRITEDASR